MTQKICAFLLTLYAGWQKMPTTMEKQWKNKSFESVYKFPNKKRYTQNVNSKNSHFAQLSGSIKNFEFCLKNFDDDVTVNSAAMTLTVT